MRLKLQSFFFPLLLLLIPEALFAGGGWTQLQAHGYFKVGAYGLQSRQHYTDTGGIDHNTTNKIFTTSFYGEYGLTNRLTVIGYVPFYSRALFNNTVSATTGELIQAGESINGLGDVDLSVKYGLIQDKPWVLAATLTLGLPLGISNGGTQGTLQTGDGEFNQMVQLDLSRGFSANGAPAWFTAYAGFNNRTNGFSDEIRFGTEVGTKLFNEKWLAIFRVYGVRSLQNGSSTDIPNSTSLFANNSEHISLSPEIAYTPNGKWGFSVMAAGAVWGRLIFASPAFSGGFFWQI